MEITSINCYLVGVGRGEEEPAQIKGTSVGKGGKLYKMLNDIFYGAHNECVYDIAFQPNNNGEQVNECRNKVIDHLKSNDIESGRILAHRLQSVTTHRSGLCLLFIIVGENNSKNRIVISRFPADTGVLADENQPSLNVEFVERIFMKSAKAYKSALFEGISYDSDFWKGKAIDKQISSDIAISDYWIKDFLMSDFATTGERGSRRLGNALKDAINKCKELLVKDELLCAVKLSKGLNATMISPESFSNRFSLSDAAKNALKAEMKEHLFTEQFQLNFEELNKLMPYRTIELDNGAFLTAEAQKFEDVFNKSEIDDGRTSFSTVGKIVDEKVRKSK